jgi:hypothetical protein
LKVRSRSNRGHVSSCASRTSTRTVRRARSRMRTARPRGDVVSKDRPVSIAHPSTCGRAALAA